MSHDDSQNGSGNPEPNATPTRVSPAEAPPPSTGTGATTLATAGTRPMTGAVRTPGAEPTRTTRWTGEPEK